MKRMFLLLVFLNTLPCNAADLKPIELDPSYQHDKFDTTPVDIKREFRAYTVSFDSADDDDDGSEIAEIWATPHWVEEDHGDGVVAGGLNAAMQLGGK